MPSALHRRSRWIRTSVQGDELFYAYMVDNQAIVIPETADAIRALTGIVKNANESIAKTNPRSASRRCSCDGTRPMPEDMRCEASAPGHQRRRYVQPDELAPV